MSNTYLTTTKFQNYSLILNEKEIYPHTNLNVWTVNAHALTVNCSALLFSNTGGNQRIVGFGNVTANLDSNYLQVGLTETSNTWYHIWALLDRSSTTVDLIFSDAYPSNINNNLPTPNDNDYTYYSYVGAVFNNKNSDFRKFIQVNNVVCQNAEDSRLMDDINDYLGISARQSFLIKHANNSIPITSHVMFGSMRAGPVDESGHFFVISSNTIPYNAFDTYAIRKTSVTLDGQNLLFNYVETDDRDDSWKWFKITSPTSNSLYGMTGRVASTIAEAGPSDAIANSAVKTGDPSLIKVLGFEY